jgi:hypothetical protein
MAVKPSVMIGNASSIQNLIYYAGKELKEPAVSDGARSDDRACNLFNVAVNFFSAILKTAPSSFCFKGGNMPRNTRLLLIAISVTALLFLTVGSAGALPHLAPNAKWTVMIYMAGDNNLEAFITSDIETELAPAG